MMGLETVVVLYLEGSEMILLKGKERIVFAIEAHFLRQERHTSTPLNFPASARTFVTH